MMSTGDASGGGSSCHAQCKSAPIATTAHTAAGSASFTVSSMKNAAVNIAATNGAHPGSGIRRSACGRASSGCVSSVSRRPVGAFGR